MSILLVHGGVNVNPSKEVLDTLKEAARYGYEVINRNIVEAVEKAIKVLEDNPNFNAGYGSVLNKDGEAEMDAGIMVSKSERAGGVAAIKGIKNPISAARKVLEETSCVLLAGNGAYKFAISKGLERSSKIDKNQLESWEKAKRVTINNLNKSFDVFTGKLIEASASDTVGCIALNDKGELAAGTSTGGSFYKIPGRVGDSPIPGAGFYASKRCAVSCSGEGEAFLELSLSKMIDIWAESINDPNILAKRAIDILSNKNRKGGIIILLYNGSYAFNHNCDYFPIAGYGDNGWITSL